MSQPSFFCAFGATVLQKHLAALQDEVEGVRLAADIEPIHRMRVASRRLRAALPLFADCFSKKEQKAWLKQLSHLTGALGAARDADVQIELVEKIEDGLPNNRLRPGVHRLRLRLTQQRSHLQKDVDAVLDALADKDFFKQFETRLAGLQTDPPVEAPYPHLLYQRCALAVFRRLDAFLAYEDALQHPEDSEKLHAMRIAAKKLRYTMETFLPLFPEGLQPYLQAVKTSQELLGDLHDCDVWTGQLPGFIREEGERTLDYYGHSTPMRALLPGLRYFEENRIQERAARYQEFVEKWQVWKEAGLWEQLKKMLVVPLIDSVYPPPAAVSDSSIELA